MGGSANSTGGAGGSGAAASGGSGGAGGALPSYVASAVTAGETHTCALLDDGRVACWGNNDDGQLGDGSFIPSAVPVVVSNLTDTVEIEAGARHTCARTSGGDLWCWGDSETGQLSASISDSNEPVQVNVSGIGGMACGTGHTCSFVPNGTAKCWGANPIGQLGNGSTSAWISVPQGVDTLLNLTSIAAGESHSCATEGQLVYCWGDNAQQQLGATTAVASSLTPRRVAMHLSPGPTLPGEDVVLTRNSGCSKFAGEAWCWGDNDFGQLGDDSTTDYYAGKKIDGLDNVLQLTGGGAHFCARRQAGNVMCWGRNTNGQVGDGSNGNNRLTPVEVSDLTGVTHVSAGESHTCAVIAEGAVVCWGDNAEGQLGTGDANPSNTPVAVTSFP